MPTRDLQAVAAAEATWKLRFYCWRQVLSLSVLTTVAVDAIAAIIEGRPPHTADITTALFERLAK